jgi:hypothetical protein
VRGGESGTKIDTLAGGSNTAAIEDVEYIQKKLFAALKIPRAYLGYDEEVGAKATLAQEDIRFSRTIQRIQKTVISELNKIAMIHLFSHGYEGEDLIDFDLGLSNPSSIAQQQKLELIRAKFEIAGTAPENLVNRNWIRKNVLALTDDEIRMIEDGLIEDKMVDLRVEGASLEEGGDEEGGDEEGGGEEGGEEGGGDEGGGLFAGDVLGGSLLTALSETDDAPDAGDTDEDDDEVSYLSMDDEDAPAKAQNQIRNAFNEPLKKSRKVTAGPASTHMPDFVKMTSVGKSGRKQDSLRKPFDDDFLRNPFSESSLPRNPDIEHYLDKKISQLPIMTKEMEGTLNKLRNSIGISKVSVLTESPDDDIVEIDFKDLGEPQDHE